MSFRSISAKSVRSSRSDWISTIALREGFTDASGAKRPDGIGGMAVVAWSPSPPAKEGIREEECKGGCRHSDEVGDTLM